MSEEVREDPLFPAYEAPVATEDPPPEVTPLHPDLAAALTQLDQDITGEMKFCRQAADSLRAFQVRYPNDVAVADGYASAIVALDNMQSILAGMQARAGQDATTRILGAVATVQSAQTAQAAREHAFAWTEMPPPEPPPPDPLTSSAEAR